MLFAVPLLLGLVIGKITGGRFSTLAAAPLRAGWLLVASFVIQVALFIPLTDTSSWDLRFGHAIYLTSMTLLLVGLVLNIGRLRWPIAVLTVGAALNVLAIAANGGAMPVDGHLLSQLRGVGFMHQLAHHKFATNVAPITNVTKLAPLGDHYRVLNGVFSIGDMLIAAGGFLTIVLEMHRFVGQRKDMPLLTQRGEAIRAA